MNILVVTHNYPRFAGDPAGAFVARIAQAAAEQGSLVQVVAPHAPGSAEREAIGSLDVRRFRYGPDLMERVAYTGDLHRRTLLSPLAALSFPAFMLAFKRAIRKAVQAFRPDVIHAHWWLPGGWLSSKAGVPYLVTCHGSDVRLLEKWNGFRTMARSVFQRAAAVTTVSGFLARDIRQITGLKLPHLTVCPMPVDTVLFAQGRSVEKAEPPIVLYAGNLVPSKGVDVLIRAAALLEQRGIAFRLRILGEGPERANLAALASTSRLTMVEWSDFRPQEVMPAEYGRSTITVLPTRGRSEGLGLTLVEALLAGSAVIGTHAGGIPEVIQHERTGLLVDETDEGLAAAIERLLIDPALRAGLIKEGQQQVEARFSLRQATGRFLQLYRDVAQHNIIS